MSTGLSSQVVLSVGCWRTMEAIGCADLEEKSGGINHRRLIGKQCRAWVTGMIVTSLLTERDTDGEVIYVWETGDNELHYLQ